MCRLGDENANEDEDKLLTFGGSEVKRFWATIHTNRQISCRIWTVSDLFIPDSPLQTLLSSTHSYSTAPTSLISDPLPHGKDGLVKRLELVFERHQCDFWTWMTENECKKCFVLFSFCFWISRVHPLPLFNVRLGKSPVWSGKYVCMRNKAKLLLKVCLASSSYAG